MRWLHVSSKNAVNQARFKGKKAGNQVRFKQKKAGNQVHLSKKKKQSMERQNQDSYTPCV